MTLTRPGTELLVYYWFHYGEHVVTSRAERRRLRDAVGVEDHPVPGRQIPELQKHSVTIRLRIISGKYISIC